VVALFTPHPLALQTAFSELKRRAQEQSFLLIGTPGSVGQREVKGRRFLYRQFYDAEGKKSAEYLGPADNPRAQARAEAVRLQIEAGGALTREARLLVRSGYVRVAPRPNAVLVACANAGLFRAGAILVGSHAYGTLLNELGIRAAAFATEDVDLARGDPLRLDVPLAFEDILASSTVPLHPVPQFDVRQPSTAFRVRGADRFHVDLLVPGRGSQVTIGSVPELRAHAAALPHLGYLLDAPLETVVFGRESVVPVRVPRPERFAWHRLTISQLRTATSEKRGKDLAQASVLVAALAEDAPDALSDAFRDLPRGLRSRALAAIRKVVADVSEHTRAVELLNDLIH
jgi:hypothetical protein